MKQTYAIVFLIILSIFLGYKFVSYRERIHNLKDEIAQLEKSNLSLQEQADKQDKARATINTKTKVIYEIIEKEIGTCDNEPIGNEFINGLRQIN